MRTELVTIPTDGIPLDGAYYEPDGGATAGAIILFHGNMMNFYVGAPRFLPPALTELGYACLSFNRRGHDILTTRDSREAQGGAFQTAAESIADNEFAADWLLARGFDQLIVGGHSNGGMLAAHYAATHPDRTRALILLSAHGGGRGMHSSGFLFGDGTEEAIVRARELVDQGRDRELMLTPGWWWVIGAASYLDRMESTPDTLLNAERIVCPSLFVRGDQESAERYPGERFAEIAPGPCEFRVVEDCDHFYVGKETVITHIVTDWLQRTLPKAAA